ncbi:hypothetical protein J6590_008567 [Homalodisca vitripennis]|nr:hypothetical protein J6590_008567 [Homalodisca vitripennis]
MTRNTRTPYRILGLLVLALALETTPVHSRPQALRVSSELGPGHDRRWDKDPASDEDKKLMEISKSFRQSRNLNVALLEVLKGLTEDELRLLEGRLEVQDELPQGDMPMEDLVEDSPQELQGDDGAEDLAGYRGELLILDNINTSASLPYNSTDTVEEPLYPQLQKINRDNRENVCTTYFSCLAHSSQLSGSARGVSLRVAYYNRDSKTLASHRARFLPRGPRDSGR